MVDLKCIKAVDPELYDSMVEELRRQQHNLELIASENIVSPAVMAAAGTFYTNKYAEGYPRKRYYGGCQYVDRAEELAIERAKELFGAKFANVQAHSGSNANFAVYYAILQPGDTVLGMSLSEGGHLTHGSPVNLSGKLFNFVSYGLNPETGRIDFDDVRKKALEYRPKLIVAGASAYARTIDFARFKEIADEVGATKEEITYALDAIQSPVSLFEPVFTDGGDPLFVMDQISDKKNLEENWVEDISLNEAMKKLPQRERHIIDMRFFEGKTQTEVAEEIHISQAQVSRLEKNALKTMRNYLS